MLGTLCKVQVQQFDENSSLTFSPVLITHHLRFAVENLLRIPNAVFGRQERSQVANSIASRLLDEKILMEIDTMLGLFNLLVQCVVSPNKSMTVVSVLIGIKQLDVLTPAYRLPMQNFYGLWQGDLMRY